MKKKDHLFLQPDINILRVFFFVFFQMLEQWIVYDVFTEKTDKKIREIIDCYLFKFPSYREDKDFIQDYIVEVLFFKFMKYKKKQRLKKYKTLYPFLYLAIKNSFVDYVRKEKTRKERDYKFLLKNE